MAQSIVNLSPLSGGIAIRRIPFDAPWYWLAAGWRDLWTTPHISIGYGVLFALIGLALTVGLTEVGWQALMLPLAGGWSDRSSPSVCMR